ncbi:MAG TPA: serine/threonine-protein kinase, partial [Thermoanaerobaculia bacterium]|nr:serine/threonine-protein kinase [Thermoanaerobaculia bacterium]
MSSRGEDRGRTSPATETVAEGSRALSRSKPLAVSTLLAQRFEVLDLLGRGGYSRVYLAWDYVLRQKVALKVLRSERISSTSIQRFRRSVALARDLHSPFLARVFDFGRDGEHLFLAMEVIEGGTLADLLRNGPLAIADAVAMARGILAGLAELHSHGILHRDLKPANILIDPAGYPKIADFDFARLQDPAITRATRGARIVGTLSYLSPEQALGDEVDVRSDLYSAGLIFFELLTGKRPYPGRSTIGSIVERLSETPVDVRRTRRDVPGWLRQIVNRLLAARPEDRYQSAPAVLADLDRERATPSPVKRRRLGPRRVILLACSIALLMAVLALSGFRRGFLHQPLKINTQRLRSGELVARDAKGHTVWTRADAASEFVPAVLAPGATRQLVGVLRSGLPAGKGRAPRLAVLDPSNGQVTQTMVLPTTGSDVPRIAAGRWRSSVRVVDLDGDGVSEILATFSQFSSPFAYTVLVEPRIGRTRTIFVSSRPGRYLGEAKLGGIGASALFFLTRSASFDDTATLTAVRLSPGVDQGSSSSWLGSIAVTPEQAWQVPDSSSLLWFSLLPERTGFSDLNQVRAVSSGSGIALLGKDGAKIELDRFGFPRSPESKDSDKKRLTVRRTVYELMRKAQRAVDRNSLSLALDLTRQARDDAPIVAQGPLTAWILRREGALLVSMDRAGDAEKMFDSG